MARIGTVDVPGRVLFHPAAEDWGAAMVAGYRCSVFGIAVVDATVRTNVVIATALFTDAFGQRNFIDRNHTSPDISISMKNDNARGRRNQTAGVASAPQLPDALSDVTAGKPAAIWRRSRPSPAVKSVSLLPGITRCPPWCPPVE